MAKVGTVGILYGADTISLQAAVHPKCTLGALNMKEEEEHWHVCCDVCRRRLFGDLQGR